MRLLMSEEEFRQFIENAYYAGWNDGESGGQGDFDDWYEEVYGGPDCE